jgi:hypothetical protein
MDLLGEFQRRQAAATPPPAAVAPPAPRVLGQRNWAPLGPTVVQKGQAVGNPDVGGRNAGIIQLSLYDLLLVIDGNVVDLPSVRVGAYCGSRQCLAVRGHYDGLGPD